MSKIVVLDGYTLNPGDLSWDWLHPLGEVHIHDRCTADDVFRLAKDAHILIINKIKLSRSILSKLPKCKFIALMATGFDNVDVQAARELGIQVSNCPNYAPAAVAQHTWALLLELTNKVGEHASSVAKGDWQKQADFSYTLGPLHMLENKTVGLIGFGNIGQRVGRIALAMGMQVCYFTPTDKNVKWATHCKLDELLKQSDVVSLHCPATTENEGLINKDRLALMKNKAILINTARSSLIDKQALLDALNNGNVAGAALDVWSPEPPTETHPLFTHINCVVTPHLAWASIEARQNLMNILEANVKGFLNGKSQNLV